MDSIIMQVIVMFSIVIFMSLLTIVSATMQ